MLVTFCLVHATANVIFILFSFFYHLIIPVLVAQYDAISFQNTRI